MIEMLQAIYDLGFETGDDRSTWCFYCGAEFQETEAHAAAMQRNMKRLLEARVDDPAEDWWEAVEPTDEIEHEPDCLYVEVGLLLDAAASSSIDKLLTL